MLIWTLALLLFAIAGACGYKLGAVRFAISLIGLIAATFLALPLGPYLKSVVPLLGLKNPIWAAVVPPLLVFLIIYAVFIGISFFVHRKVELYYKYKSDDRERISWERVNHALGLWVGAAMGGVWLLLIGLVVYVAGYFTVQVTTDETNSLPVKMLSQARQDLHSTGLEKAVAPFDPMPARYYEASDILGTIYQNPILISRLTQYPPFLLFGERTEFQELANDTEFNQMLLSKADAMTIVKHPKLQAILQNADIVQELLGQDLKDLRTYLETGVSPKFEEEKILGKWKLDPYATMAQERKRHPDMSSTEMRRLKTVMTEIMSTVTVVATTDKKVNLKADGVNDKLNALFQPAAPKPAADAQPAAATVSPQVAQRYGLGARGGARPAAQATVPVAVAKPTVIPYQVLSAQGAWDREGDKYQLKVQDEKGKGETLQASADDDRLIVNTPAVILVFAKAD